MDDTRPTGFTDSRLRNRAERITAATYRLVPASSLADIAADCNDEVVGRIGLDHHIGVKTPLGRGRDVLESEDVLEGAITFEEEGRPPITKKAGEMFHETPGVRLTPKNASQTEPVKLLVIDIKDKGQPVTVDVQ